MKKKHIYRVEICSEIPSFGDFKLLHFLRLPTKQDILDVLTAQVEEGWDGKAMNQFMGTPLKVDPSMASHTMEEVRQGNFRIFREKIWINKGK